VISTGEVWEDTGELQSWLSTVFELVERIVGTELTGISLVSFVNVVLNKEL